MSEDKSIFIGLGQQHNGLPIAMYATTKQIGGESDVGKDIFVVHSQEPMKNNLVKGPFAVSVEENIVLASTKYTCDLILGNGPDIGEIREYISNQFGYSPQFGTRHVPHINVMTLAMQKAGPKTTTTGMYLSGEKSPHALFGYDPDLDGTHDKSRGYVDIPLRRAGELVWSLSSCLDISELDREELLADDTPLNDIVNYHLPRNHFATIIAARAKELKNVNEFTYELFFFRNDEITPPQHTHI